MNPQWENVMQVRVKEHLYTEFKQAARKFPTNKAKYLGKYVPKVWATDQIFMNRYLTFKGLAGAFNKKLFFMLKSKTEGNILKRIRQIYKTMPNNYGTDTHDQSVNYVFHSSDIVVDPVEWIGHNGPAQDEEADYIVSRDTACFGGMGYTFENHIENGYNALTGYFCADDELSSMRVLKWIELCREWNLLSDEIFTTVSTFEGLITYKIVFKNSWVRFDKLYFQLSMLRFVMEYHGTLNVMFDLMGEFKLCMPLALTLAMMLQTQHRWLHVPWNMTGHAKDMKTAVAFTRAILKFDPGKGLFSAQETEFRTTDKIDSILDFAPIQMVNDYTTVNHVPALNTLIGG